MKRILFIVATLLATLSASAANIAAGEGQVWWGTTTGSTSSIKMIGIGSSGITGQFDLAQHFPGDAFYLEGKKLCAVRFYMPNISTSDMSSNVTVWVSTTLPSKVENADVFRVDTLYSKLTKGRFNDIALPEVYTITNKGFYIGVSFTINGTTSANAQKPIAYVSPLGYPKSYVRAGSVLPNWTDFSDNGTLPMMALLEGEFPAGAARAVSVGSTKSLVGAENQRATLRLENFSPKGVSSIGYTVTDMDGNTSEERTVRFTSALRVMGQGSLNIVLPPATHAGTYSPRVTITKVNGNENALTGEDAYADGFSLVLAENAEKRVVEEEFTGTWCGWCPRGMVGLELAEKNFGDKFIGIAVHSGDVMASSTAGYSNVLNNVSGFPSCFLDRNYSYSCDPYMGSKGTNFGIKSDIESFLTNICEADIVTHPVWTDANRRTIEVSTYVYFKMDSEDKAPYAIGYVLTADSLHGSSSSWVQANYYGGQSSSDSNMSKFTSGKTSMAGLYFNHVAIWGKGVDSGIEGSITAPIRAGEAQVHQLKFTIPSSTTLVQDKNQLHLVALLFDTETGLILNAAKAPILDHEVGITHTESDVASELVVARYDAQGRRVASPVPGINILRYADGHTAKVIY